MLLRLGDHDEFLIQYRRSAINEHAAMIDAKKQRGLLRRILEASGDGQDIVKAFRDISFLVDVFTVRIHVFLVSGLLLTMNLEQMHTSISTEIALDQAARDSEWTYTPILSSYSR